MINSLNLFLVFVAANPLGNGEGNESRQRDELQLRFKEDSEVLHSDRLTVVELILFYLV